MPAARALDVTRTTLQVLTIGALIVSSLLVLQPFLVALAWGATIAIATWPVLLRVQGALRGRRGLAVLVMTSALAFTVVLPVFFAITTLVRNAPRVEEWATSLTHVTVPAPPSWVESLPLVGGTIADQWRAHAAASASELSAYVMPAARAVGLWFVGQAGSVATFVIQLLLTIIVTAILYANGEAAVDMANRFARRLAGPRGAEAVHLAALAVRAVALGVVVTAVVQSLLGGLGLVVAAVPFAGFFTALMFVLGIAQVGAGPVLVGATIWVYVKSGAAWGTVFLVWAIFCTVLDNFLRPMLIKRGADLPLLLIFAGVIGGLVAFGIIGLFIGPVLLAVAYTLLVDWIADA